MSMMEYKGYYGTVTFDDEVGTFFGRVNNLPKDGITFEGKSVEELRTAFRESVDDYLAWCKERGEAYSGKFNIRISPDLHAKAAVKAQARGESLNDFVTKAIEDEIETGVIA